MTKRIVMIFMGFIFFFVILIIGMFLFDEVSAKTITVAKDGSGDYEKIQDAIDNANIGNSVFVSNGTYFENVVVNKTINLTGESRENTVIDGNKSGDVVRIEADWVNLSGFLIKNSGEKYYQDGIEVMSKNNQITNCIISNNSGSGKGIYFYKSTNNQIKNCTFSKNGISLESFSNNNQIKNCIISSGGISLRDYYDNQIKNCTISNSGIFLGSSSNNQIINCTLNNSSRRGIYISYSSNNKIINCSISDNSENGIYIGGSSNNQIMNSTISNNSGGGIYFYWDSSNNQITNCTISDNLGTGCYIRYDSSLQNIIHHNNFINNLNQSIDQSINDWDNGFIGNYWSDYIGKDDNKDGIGDVPYIIKEENQDNYPLMGPVKTSLFANFTYSPNNPKITDPIEFFDLSNCSDGKIVSFYWDFGDGNISYEKNPIHIYSQKMNYSVRLIILDEDNSRDECIKKIQFENIMPKSNFTYSPTEPTTLEFIEFFDGSLDIDGLINSWRWDFGDDNESNEQNPIHKYFLKRTYTVSLTVIDNDGASDTFSLNIDVKKGIQTNIIKTNPSNKSIDILVGSILSITFSKSMNQSSVSNSIQIIPSIYYTISWQESTLILKPTSNLDFKTTYTITISPSAKDLEENNLKCYQFYFTTETLPPNIFHTPITVGIEGNPIMILAKITDDNAVKNAYLFYRKSGTKEYLKIQMEQKGDNHIVEIPAEDVTTAGIEYYIFATYGKNNATHPSENPENNPHKFNINHDPSKNLPDLIISSLDFIITSADAIYDESVIIYLNISNIGRIQATNIEIIVYNFEKIIKTKTIDIIKAGDYYRFSFKYVGKNRTFNLIGIIDPEDKIKELNETNNEAHTNRTFPSLKEDEFSVIVFLLITIVLILISLLFTINLWYPKKWNEKKNEPQV